MKASISPSVPMGYRPEIDGLRGVAVLAVIINHFNDKLLPGGYLGVDVFFAPFQSGQSCTLGILLPLRVQPAGPCQNSR